MSLPPLGDDRVRAILKRALPRLLPLLFLMTFASYLDRGNVSVLATSINTSLDMTATTFGFAVGLFFWGYVIFEIPSNVALHRFGGRIWLARIMISWGLVTGLTALVQTDWQFAIARFLLGAAEAGLIPGILYYLTSWVPRHRQQATFSLFQVAVPVSLLFTALVTSALLAAVQPFVSSDLEWRSVMVIQGVLTIVIGILALFLLPSRPREAKWLDADDAAYLERTIEAEGENTEPTRHDLGRVWRVLRSGRAWYLSVTALLMLTGSWAVIFWLPQIVAGYFKTDAVASGFISAIPWAVAIIALLVTRVTAMRTGDRRFHMLIALGIGAIGLLVSALVSNGVVAVAGLSLALAAVQVSIPLLIGVQSMVFTGVMTATVLAMVNSIGSFGGTIGPLIFGVSVDTFGGVAPAIAAMAIALAAAAVMAFFSERVALGRDVGTVSAPAGDLTAKGRA
jgi:MFS transporter, ACS family, tartrate transporter